MADFEHATRPPITSTNKSTIDARIARLQQQYRREQKNAQERERAAYGRVAVANAAWDARHEKWKRDQERERKREEMRYKRLFMQTGRWHTHAANFVNITPRLETQLRSRAKAKLTRTGSGRNVRYVTSAGN